MVYFGIMRHFSRSVDTLAVCLQRSSSIEGLFQMKEKTLFSQKKNRKKESYRTRQAERAVKVSGKKVLPLKNQ